MLEAAGAEVVVMAVAAVTTADAMPAGFVDVRCAVEMTAVISGVELVVEEVVEETVAFDELIVVLVEEVSIVVEKNEKFAVLVNVVLAELGAELVVAIGGVVFVVAAEGVFVAEDVVVVATENVEFAIAEVADVISVVAVVVDELTVLAVAVYGEFVVLFADAVVAAGVVAEIMEADVAMVVMESVEILMIAAAVY